MFIFAMMMAGMAATAADLPDQLKFLTQLESDDRAMADAVRTYDRTQSSFVTLELKFAKKDAENGRADAAKEKQLDAKKRLQSVRTAYEYALGKFSKNAKLKNYYGELLYDQFDEQTEAVKCWQEATLLSPDFGPPYNNLAIHYCHFGDYKLGLHYYDQAIQREPDNPDYLFNLAQMYLVNFPQVQEIRGWDKKKLFNEAMKLSKKAADLSPNDFELAQDYAVNFFAADNFDVVPDWRDAASAWQHTREMGGGVDRIFYTWLNEGRVWMRDGNKSRAAACFEKALSLRPQDQVARKLLDQAKARETSVVGQEKRPGVK